MKSLLKKYFLGTIWVILTTVIGAILGNYLNLSWIILVGAIVGLLLFTIYTFFLQEFQAVNANITNLQSKVANMEFALGSISIGGHLSWVTFWIKVQQLAGKIEASDYRPDIVVSIGRSGAVVGGMLASMLGSIKHVSLDRLVIIKCGDHQERCIEIDKSLVPNPKEFSDRKMLIVMSECRAGETLHEAYQYFRNTTPGVTIKTAVLFSKPNVKFGPNYCVEIAEDWPKLPFRDDRWKEYYPRFEKNASSPENSEDFKKLSVNSS